MGENRRPILLTEVWSLAIYLRGVVQVPEGFDQRLVVDFLRIEFDLHHLGVASLVGADVFVRRIFGVAVAVADQRVHYSGNHAKFYFDSPEASGSECSEFSHGKCSLPVRSSDCSAIADQKSDAREEAKFPPRQATEGV